MPNKDVATKYGVRRNTVLTWVKSKDKLIASLKRSEENAREARKYQSMVSFLKKKPWNLRKYWIKPTIFASNVVQSIQLLIELVEEVVNLLVL